MKQIINKCNPAQVDNFSTFRKHAKGFIPVRVDDPDKMRDYEVIRGYFQRNNLAYITNKIRIQAVKLSRLYGREKEILKVFFVRKLKKITTFPGALAVGFCMVYFEFTVRLLRFLTLNIPCDKKALRKSMIFDKYDYILFGGKEYVDINFKDIWRPSIICIPGEIIKARFKKADKSEIRIGFALLENADPRIFSGDYEVNIKYSLISNRHTKEGAFSIPIYHEDENMEHNEHSLWLDFKISLDGFLEEEIEFSLQADYQRKAVDKIKLMPMKTPAIAWGAPRIIKNKLANKTKKILVLSLETMTDPWFISETYGIPVEHLFTFLNDKEWVRFKRSYAQSDGTLGTAGSLFSGLTPVQHGLFDYGSPFYTKYNKSWPPNLVTLSQLLKEKEFSTNCGGVKAFSGYFGCSRGLDSLFSCYTLHELDYPDFDWFIQAWDAAVNNDAIIFWHVNKLHKPYTKWNRRINRVYSAEWLIDNQTALDKYIKQMDELDIQFKRLINFLKCTGQYENTLIICIGDHGGAYAWQKRQAYDLYEDRIRVPLWVKEANWSKLSPLDLEQPVNATIFPFQAVLKQLDIPPPAYFQKLAQVNPALQGIAITETSTAPTRQDYVLSLTDQSHKYIRFMKVDWERNIILSRDKELLQPYKYASKDYGLNTDCSSNEPAAFKKMRQLADMHIESSFEFRRNNPLVD